MNSLLPETAERCLHTHAQLHLATQPSTQHQRVLLAACFVQNNLHCELSLDEIAATVQLSRSRFNGFFKKVTDLPPARYIKLLKMETARQLLATGFPSTTEVMDKVGIKDHSHFCRNFKRLYGVTPARYRDHFPRDVGNPGPLGQ